MVKVTGGNLLAGRLKDIAAKIGSGPTVQVGWFPDATYRDGTLVAMVAAIQEFGAPKRNIPPRPFFRSIIKAHQAEWPEAIAANLAANDFDAARTLGQVGEVIAGQLAESITAGSYTPLKPTTVAAKGFDKPLVDTGRMLQSIKSVVKSE